MSNSRTTTKPTTHNRVKEHLAEEEVRRAAEEAADKQLSGEQLQSRMKSYIAGRKQARRIAVGEDTEKASSIDEAVVKTTKGMPDMRFAENRNRFMKDTAAKINGRPDNRFVENRSDILELHVQRGEDRPNLIFGDDGEIEE